MKNINNSFIALPRLQSAMSWTASTASNWMPAPPLPNQGSPAAVLRTLCRLSACLRSSSGGALDTRSLRRRLRCKPGHPKSSHCSANVSHPLHRPITASPPARFCACVTSSSIAPNSVNSLIPGPTPRFTTPSWSLNPIPTSNPGSFSPLSQNDLSGFENYTPDHIIALTKNRTVS